MLLVYATWGPFLNVTQEQIQESVDTNIVAAFAFAREVILLFKDQELNEHGKRGTLIFTGAFHSVSGKELSSVFGAGKFGLRALSQSLNKEFGKQNIHVSI
jgi:short-subunit dehydrogenase